MIVSLSAILISILAVQDSHSDDGMLYVKSYVPGDLQLTAGSIFENIMGGDVPSIPGKAMKELQKIPGISQIQDYRINYNRSVFLCEDPQSLNTDGAYYDTMLAMEQEIGGKPQCLYSLLLVTTNSLHTLLPSYQVKAGGHIAIMDTELADTLNLRIGDTFSLYDEPLITAGSKDECRQIRVTLADTRETVLSENHLGGNLLITDQKTARFFGGRQSRQVVNVWVQNGMEDLAASSLERLCSFYGCSFHSAARQMQAYADTGKNQRRMHQFMILILGTMGVCIYFHTVFANLLSRRHDFWTMHKIGIQKKELYWMVLKEGACQGIFAAGLTGIVQAALAAVPGVPATLFSVSAWTDAGLLFICMAFPVFILFYIARKNLQF